MYIRKDQYKNCRTIERSLSKCVFLGGIVGSELRLSLVDQTETRLRFREVVVGNGFVVTGS